jgi:HlyD family secretion protein
MKKIIALIVAIVALAGTGYWYWHAKAGTGNRFRTAEIVKGHLEATVGSTGTLQPSEIVDVGAQVVGRIVMIGKDPSTKSGIVDWGSEVEGPVVDTDGNVVKPGTILAQIDDDLYKAQLRAALATVKSTQADLLQKTAVLGLATEDWERAKRLKPTGGIAKAEYDQFKSNYEVAQANIEVSKAQIDVAQANLKTAQTNLNYTTITAPVKGLVIDRRVNVGQTVVASLSAPSLFLIAKDLPEKIEVWATVNEVDVGKIRAGQDVKFTVDAFPGRLYRGKVIPQGKLPFRLNATMNQNVVTYTVVVSVDNKDGLLRPYLTANLTFIVANKKDALLVPNAALRWQPAREQIEPAQRDSYYQLKGKKRSPTDVESQDQGFIWVKADDPRYVRYIQVRTGLSDTVNTEILGTLSGEEVSEKKTQVIVGEGKTDNQSAGANPFVPQIFKPKPKE